MNLIEEIREFYKYCNSFYNKTDGVYPIASIKEIRLAVDIYIKSSKSVPLRFDSYDREQVREIIGK